MIPTDFIGANSELITEIRGREDRRRMVDGAAYSAVCALASYAGGREQSIKDTGWLASPRLVITAAPVLFNRSPPERGDFGCAHEGYARLVKLTFRGIDGSRHYRKAYSWRLRVHASYRLTPLNSSNSSAVSRDVGAVLIDPLPDGRTIPLRYGTFTDTRLAASSPKVVGFAWPADRHEPVLLAHQGPLIELGAGYLLHATDTDHRQSGAPLSIVSDDDGPTVVAMPLAGARQARVGARAGNLAERIDEALEHWISSMR